VNSNDPIDPSALNDYVCPLCQDSFLALFLYLRHSRERHGSRLAPLSPSTESKQERGGMTLTPAERQEMLRRLKHGPVMSKKALAEYANKLKKEVLKKRKNAPTPPPENPMEQRQHPG